MKKLTELYRKNELLFSLVWIGAYVLLFSLADGLSETIGTEKLLTAPAALLMSALLLCWIRRNGLSEKYGLVQKAVDRKQVLFYVPLVVLVSLNLWGGVSMRLTVPESVLYVITMLCVGFLEEVIFRGFLFQTLVKDNVTQAIIIASVTFGFGHIVNLLNGAEFVPTLLQVCYATAIGYLFTILFYRTGTLIPCILAHGVFNSLSAFGAERTTGMEIAVVLMLIALPVLYAQWVQRGDWKNMEAEEDVQQ